MCFTGNVLNMFFFSFYYFLCHANLLYVSFQFYKGHLEYVLGLMFFSSVMVSLHIVRHVVTFLDSTLFLILQMISK